MYFVDCIATNNNHNNINTLTKHKCIIIDLSEFFINFVVAGLTSKKSILRRFDPRIFFSCMVRLRIKIHGSKCLKHIIYITSKTVILSCS